MQKDLSAVAEFAKRFATEAACRDYLIQNCAGRRAFAVRIAAAGRTGA